MTVAGNGAGTVHTSIAGLPDLACSTGTCTVSVPGGADVYLYATAQPGSALSANTLIQLSRVSRRRQSAFSLRSTPWT